MRWRLGFYRVSRQRGLPVARAWWGSVFDHAGAHQPAALTVSCHRLSSCADNTREFMTKCEAVAVEASP
jgi:hypothetical protein